MPSPASSRRQWLRGFASFATLGCASLAGARERVGQTEERTGSGWHFRIARVPLELPHLPSGLDGFRIVQISDLHLEPFTKAEHIEETVKACNALAPDLVAMTGDFMTNNTDAMGLLAELLGELQARHGVFASLGNHDLWAGPEVVERTLRERCMPMLRNETRQIHTDGGTLCLAGMDTRYMGRVDLRKTLAGWQPGQPLVMMMHEPDVADTLAAVGVPALQLSGHTHGGQLRLLGMPPLLRRARWGKKYIEGRYRVGQVQLYVNRGIGCVGVPWRITCPPEITEFTLRSGEVMRDA